MTSAPYGGSHFPVVSGCPPFSVCVVTWYLSFGVAVDYVSFLHVCYQAELFLLKFIATYN